jgi:hypothetical protein
MAQAKSLMSDFPGSRQSGANVSGGTPKQTYRLTAGLRSEPTVGATVELALHEEIKRLRS